MPLARGAVPFDIRKSGNSSLRTNTCSYFHAGGCRPEKISKKICADETFYPFAESY